MKSKWYLLTLFLSCFMLNIAIADEAIPETKPEDDGFDYEFSFDAWEFKDFKSILMHSFVSSHKQPKIDVFYGLSQPGINKDYFSQDFDKSGFAEVKLGYTRLKLHSNQKVLRFSDSYLRFSYQNNEMGFSGNNLKMWNLSWGDSEGYGWAVTDDVDIMLYSGDIMNWGRVDFAKTSPIEGEQARLDRFSDNLRFGKSMEAGMRIRLFKNVGITAAYEQQHVFARCMFWYWAGSEIIEGIASGLASGFISDVIDNSSTAGPIVNFIIKNGISYAFYELRKKDMNWPFKTEAPLVLNNFKVGLSFTF